MNLVPFLVPLQFNVPIGRTGYLSQFGSPVGELLSRLLAHFFTHFSLIWFVSGLPVVCMIIGQMSPEIGQLHRETGDKTKHSRKI
jgi:hypothetical protein